MTEISKLLEIMQRLRDPDEGCLWDLRQTFASVAPYTLEEAYEVVDAIERGDLDDLRDELGDLLLQVVFHAQMARDAGAFEFSDVVESISDKMIRRHPHVFSNERIDDEAHLRQRWETVKQEERARRGDPGGVLTDVPRGLPALSQALKLSRRAATVGFEWPEVAQVRAKVDEELGEVDELLATGERGSRLEEELGDALFAMVNLCRQVGVDPESALRRCNRKFTRRFEHIEQAVIADGGKLSETPLETLERHWQEAKTLGL